MLRKYVMYRIQIHGTCSYEEASTVQLKALVQKRGKLQNGQIMLLLK